MRNGGKQMKIDYFHTKDSFFEIGSGVGKFGTVIGRNATMCK